MSNQRVPQGVPTGGQFAASARSEAVGVSLAEADPTAPVPVTDLRPHSVVFHDDKIRVVKSVDNDHKSTSVEWYGSEDVESFSNDHVFESAVGAPGAAEYVFGRGVTVIDPPEGFDVPKGWVCVQAPVSKIQGGDILFHDFTDADPEREYRIVETRDAMFNTTEMESLDADWRIEMTDTDQVVIARPGPGMGQPQWMETYVANANQHGWALDDDDDDDEYEDEDEDEDEGF